MQWLAGNRIALTPRPVRRRDAVLETAMLGHYPNSKDPRGEDLRERARRERLLQMPTALDEMRGAGFGAEVDALQAGRMPDGSALTPRLAGLYHLPLPLRSSAEFHDVFPDSLGEPTRYASLLAGAKAWLALAVDEYFANGGQKLWVVRIPEAEGQAGFLPPADAVLHDVETLRGLAAALVISSVASVAFPDLERLQIPARLPDTPRLQLENPNPQFLPCGTDTDDDHRERRHSTELVSMPDPHPFEHLLRGILPFVARHRPDVQCLLTLPLAYSGELGSPVVDPRALACLKEIPRETRHLLRHVQFVFPYLRGPQLALHSAAGAIAGKQAAVAETRGPWYSIAALPLDSYSVPYPRLSIAQTLALREEPGISALQQRTGFAGRKQLCLDDERLVVPALPPADYENAESPAPGAPSNGSANRFDGFRSAEIMRFLGFLRRQLQLLGDQLVFNVDVNDARPRLLLERFFRRLYSQGALRGRVPEEAFQIRQSRPQESAVQFDIELAPAFPIDRIFLTFVNRDGEWQAEVVDG